MKRIILVRHGSTDWVDNHIMHGVTDIPLNEKGLNQARKAANTLRSAHPKAVYTSPLTRCRQTAELIARDHSLEPIDNQGLKEMDFGWLEGHQILHFQIQDSNHINKFLYRLWRQFIQILSGESEKSFKQRVLSTWKQILDENPDGTIIIVAHILVFKTILQYYFGEPNPGERRRYFIAPTGISEIQVDDQGRADLVRLNDTGHLTEGEA